MSTTAFGADGDISKALAIIAPAANTEEKRSAVVRVLLKDGFVIVRQETRVITKDVAMKLCAGTSWVASTLVGSACLIAVAASNAAQSLESTKAAQGWSSGDIVVSPADHASAQLSVLFPRMSVDAIPSNAEAREFVNGHLKTLLVKGLTLAAKQKPSNAVQFFAEFLMENNPRRPPVAV